MAWCGQVFPIKLSVWLGQAGRVKVGYGLARLGMARFYWKDHAVRLGAVRPGWVWCGLVWSF